MNLLNKPLCILIPIISVNDIGVNENVSVKLTVYSNNINVGEVVFDSISASQNTLVSFPCLSPRGEFQQFTITYKPSHTVLSKTYDSYLEVLASAESIPGEEYTFTFEYEVLTYTLKHTYVIDCPQDYVVPIYVNSVSSERHSYILQGSNLILYKCNIRLPEPSYYINNMLFVGDNVFFKTLLNTSYSIVVNNTTTRIDNMALLEFFLDSNSNKITIRYPLSTYNYSIGLSNTPKYYSKVSYSDNLGIGNVSILEYSKLIGLYITNATLESSLKLDNNVDVTISSGFTTTSFNKTGTLAKGKSVFYTGNLCLNFQPTGQETNFKSNVVGKYLITTPIVTNTGLVARNSIVTITPNLVQPTTDINFNGTAITIPVKLYKFKTGFQNLVKYLNTSTIFVAKDETDIVIDSITTSVSTTPFLDLEYAIVGNKSIVLSTPDIVYYDLSKDAIDFYTLTNDIITISWTDILGETQSDAGVDIKLQLLDGVYDFTITVGVTTQVITIVKTTELDSYYEKIMLMTSIDGVSNLDTQLFLSLKVLIDSKLETYNRTNSVASKQSLSKLLTKFNESYVQKF